MERRYFAAVLFISIALLAAEMGSIRYMSVVNYSNFAAMIISVALLGFGVSGVLITIYKNKIERELENWLFLSTSLFILFSGYVFILSKQVPFVPQSIYQDSRQILYLGFYYIIFFLPFFFGSFFINLSFLKMKKRINLLYFFNMVGSGLGAFLIVLLMSHIAPQYLMIPVMCFGTLALFLQIKKTIWLRQLLLAGMLLVVAFIPYFSGVKLKISQYKDISYALKVPLAKVIKTVLSPLGYIQIVKSEQFHFAPGLSLSSYSVHVPNEYGLFIDGISHSGIATNFKGKDAEYITYLPFSIPFVLIKRPDILILGAEGGNSVLYAERLNAHHITAVESNYSLISTIRTDFRKYCAGLWDKRNLNVQISDSRSFCKRSKDKYDIILISGMVSSGMSFSSGSGYGESYLFTKEALSDYNSLLKKNGILYISMKMQSPPRTLLKLESLAFSYLKKRFPYDFYKRVIFVRGLDWGVVMVKNGLFTHNEIDATKRKVSALSADFSYFPGIQPEDTNINNQITNELYYKLAMAYLGNTEKHFLNSYFFNINPPSDNKPYFNQFLRFSAVSKLFGPKSNMENIPFSEWGYLLLWATLLQGIIFSMFIILFPIITSGKRFLKEKGKIKLTFYFSSLGMAYMLIEIAVIQEFTLFIANPLYSVALVVSSLLIFSGVGSGFSSRYTNKPFKGIMLGVLGIILFLCMHMFIFPTFLNKLFGLPEVMRMCIAILFLGPLGFFMGFPFPLGLQVLSDRKEVFLPWALAINGSVSVFATVFTSILSIQLGFVIVFLLAAGFYLLAYFNFPGRIKYI